MTLRARSRSNLHLPLPEPAVEEWWEGGSSHGSIEEERGASEYDCGILDLGAESPSASSPNLVENNAFMAQWAQAGIAVPRVPARRPSWRASSGKERSLKKESVDRDCGICFEYAVVPCRTLCCGKIFCTEHLADWLHGPNAQGRCPNCENICSLDSTTLSLATPALLPASEVPTHDRRRRLSANQQSKPKPGVYLPSPLIAVQPHDNDTLDSHAPGSSSSSSSATISTPDSDEEGKTKNVAHGLPLKLAMASPSTTPLSTTPFSTSWGAISRLMSIVTFMMFLYKLLS
ncbi:hypothetical protein BJ912DRAFT_978641 [Pholiota molesta]|nr:hypothetical protein BJ912DRAFT_978641 [Pholiota molesta]